MGFSIKDSAYKTAGYLFVIPGLLFFFVGIAMYITSNDPTEIEAGMGLTIFSFALILPGFFFLYRGFHLAKEEEMVESLAMIEKINPNLLFRNRHINTIYASKFRVMPDIYTNRFRLELSDGDFLDIDTTLNNNRRAAVIIHGLGGHSHRGYVLGLADIFMRNGYDIFGVNLRGCSGETNRLKQTYHAGKFEDISEIIDYISKKHKYKSIGVAGFSLGGVMTSRHLIESGNSSANFGVAISAPFDLESTSQLLSKSRFYMSYFLKKLRREMEKKAAIFPEISLEGYDSIRSFAEYDERYTAPLNGFSSAKDYWRQSSTISKLDSITQPFLIISSVDDPVLSEASLPRVLPQKRKNCEVEITRYGGHTGFIEKRNNICWHEKRLDKFLKQF
ncbi:MAG: alpha/beta fold hydrolase [Spirochaetes bacterium]|jgi:predicted alpha/beta-fold hydrolase|nr:alpha/beta fold hydrolase [Spirochaetota bacterium]